MKTYNYYTPIKSGGFPMLRRRHYVLIASLFILLFIMIYNLSYSQPLPPIHQVHVEAMIDDDLEPEWFYQLRDMYSKPTLFDSSLEPIPKLIHQTGRVPYDNSELQTNYGEALKSWKELNPNYEYTYFTDDMMNEFVSLNFPREVVDAFRSLPQPILKADFFRYLILYAKGGVYSDIDTKCLKPISEWTKPKPDWPVNYPSIHPIRLIIGIEADAFSRSDWHDWYTRPLQIVQWTIAATPGHPALLEVIRRIVLLTQKYVPMGVLKDHAVISTDDQNAVMEWTGPAVWTDSVFSYIGLFNAVDAKRIPYTKSDVRNLNKKFKGIANTFSDLRYPRKIGPIGSGAVESWKRYPARFSKVYQPKGLDPFNFDLPHFDDTLLLPITGFSPGVGEGDKGVDELSNEQAFVHHTFGGSWRPNTT